LTVSCSQSAPHHNRTSSSGESRCEGQSWYEVLDALEDAAGDSEPIPVELLEAWQRIVPQARALLGDMEITEHEQESRDLSHSDTGIDLSFFGNEV
jgi:hypothetical protein